jgi:hypothetical protein
MIEPPLGLLSDLLPLRSALHEQLEARVGTQISLGSVSLLKFELLPYAVSEMWHAFTSFVRIAHSIAEEEGEGIPVLPQCLVLSDLNRDLLAYSIDAFMSAGRRAQNAVPPYLSSALGPLERSLPKSLADVFINHYQTNISKYPALKPFAPLLESYWQTDGKRLKAYRDLMEHHTLVASEAFLARSEANGIVLHILLPNNPDTKNQVKLSYGNPPEHALLYMEQAFTALVRFADSITRLLLPAPLPPKAYVIIPNRIAPLKTPKVFHPIPSIEDISARVKQFIQAERR